MSFLEIIFGDPNKKVIKELEPVVSKINELESSFISLSSDELRAKTSEFKERLNKGETLDNILPEAFATVREAARRKLGQRHYDVQLMGGIVLHRGEITEMKTGEGKTLTSTLPIYLNALTGKGVHVVTVNDYLARRDAVWMGQVYAALGLTVGSIQHESAFLYDESYKHTEENKEEHDKERDTTGSFRVHYDYLKPVSRKEAYQTDITYGTNNEFGFDYLRDNMVGELHQMVQRNLHYAIVDEVDSILIDEARTPLIISAPAEESDDQYYRFAEMVRKLQPVEDYTVDEKERSVHYTEAGQDKVTSWVGKDPWTTLDTTMIFHLEAALRAQALYKREKEYVIKDDEIIIVDEFTGRLMHGRRFSEGLHQALEAKEGVKIQRESRTLATITFQNFFRMYKKLAGMTGTALTESEEFSKIYGMEVTAIPTNKPLVRHDLSDRVYATEKGKFKAVVSEIKNLQEKGQPVLVGTGSIEKNELLGELLSREGIQYEILNAKNHEREAEIIAQAGRSGAVTVATNMAGRGVDIILGGNPPDAGTAKKVRDLGGLHVLGTERHESRRIDNQLRGRAGRQGDPGTTQFYVSMEDDLLRIFGPDRMKNLMQKMGLPEDQAIEHNMVSKSIESAQKKVEGHNFDIRKHLLEYDDVLNKHREFFYQKRREVIDADASNDANAIREWAFELVEDEIGHVVSFHTASENEQDWDMDSIIKDMHAMFLMSQAGEEGVRVLRKTGEGKLAAAEARTSIIETLVGLAREAYLTQEKEIGNPEILKQATKGLVLQTMDRVWVEHLDAMHHLRTGIGLRGYGQRDPLIEYKKESHRMFRETQAGIQQRIVYSIFKISAAMHQAPKSLLEQHGIRLSGAPKTSGGGEGPGIKNEKIGRNDPCYCGSGKKYKKCHGK